MQTKIQIAAISAAIMAAAHASIQGAVEYSNFALQTGLSARQMKIWQYAAEQNNVSGQELIQTIKAIQRAQAEILMGGGNARPFYQLGINVREQDTFKVLEQLRTKTASMPPAIASQIMGQMGVGQNFLNIFRSQSFELDRVNKGLILTEKEYGKLLQLNRELKDLTFTLSTGMARFVISIKPALDTMIAMYKRMAMGAQEVFDHIGKMIERFPLIKSGLVAIGAIAMIAFAPITAALLGLMLIIDDIYVYMHGGDSLIGRIEKFFQGLDFMPKWLTEFKPLITSIKNIVTGELVQALEGAKVLGTVVFQIIEFGLSKASVILNFFVGVMSKVMEFFNSQTPGRLSMKEFGEMQVHPELKEAYYKGQEYHFNQGESDTFRKSDEYKKYSKEQQGFFEKGFNYTTPFEGVMKDSLDVLLKGILSAPLILRGLPSPLTTPPQEGAKVTINNSFLINEATDAEAVKNSVADYFQKSINSTSSQIPVVNVGYTA